MKIKAQVLWKRSAFVMMALCLLAVIPANTAEAATISQNVSLPCIPPLCTPDLVGQFQNSILSMLAKEFGAGTAWLFTQLAIVATTVTKVDLEAAWYDHEYSKMLGYAIVLSLIFSLLAFLRALAKRDTGTALARIMVDIMIFVSAIFFLRGFVTFIMSMVDEGSGYLASDMQANTAKAAERLAKWTFSGQIPAIVILVLAFFAFMSIFVLFFVLFVTQAGVYLVVFFMPWYFAGRIWEGAANVFKSAMRILAACLFAKLLIIPAASLGMAMFASLPENPTQEPGAMWKIIPALFILGCAGLMPMLLMKIIGVAQEAYALSGIKQETRIVTTPILMGVATVRNWASHGAGSLGTQLSPTAFTAAPQSGNNGSGTGSHWVGSSGGSGPQGPQGQGGQSTGSTPGSGSQTGGHSVGSSGGSGPQGPQGQGGQSGQGGYPPQSYESQPGGFPIGSSQTTPSQHPTVQPKPPIQERPPT